MGWIEFNQLLFRRTEHVHVLSSTGRLISIKNAVSAISGLQCYGRLAVVSDVDNEGFVLNVDGRMVQDLDYIGVHITEQSVDIAKTNTRMMNEECNKAPVDV
jgi:hypothetical protein